MGRKKISSEEKKGKLSIAISKTNLDDFESFKIKNKSQFIEWLLNNYFDNLKK